MNDRRPLPARRWGHVTILLGVAGLIGWYFLDAAGASSNLQNLILIAPLAVIGLSLIALILIAELRAVRFTEPGPERLGADADAAPARVAQRYADALILLLVAAYVGAIPVLRLEVASGLFMAAAVFVLGERRPVVIAGAAVFGVGIAVLAHFTVPVDLPTWLGA